MNLMVELERDKALGLQVMEAAGIRTTVMPTNGLQINVLTWFSNGQQVGPIFTYLGNETAIELFWPYRIKEPRLYQQTIKKAAPIIKNTNHTGHVGMRVFISPTDHKAYGIRWQTTLTKELVNAMCGVLKPSFAEWSNRLEDVSKCDDLSSIVHYKYAGSIIDRLNEVNTHLLAFRVMGYELPLNSGERLSPVAEV